MCFKNGKRGFTLIELLVVISIIALLMAILIPALRAAKEAATGSVCLNNQHELAMAWFTYSIDNKGKLIDGNTENEESWVRPPTDEDGTNVSNRQNYTLEDEKRGIKRGSLFPYLKDVDVYNCPGDKRHRRPPTDTVDGKGQNGGFRSYSITSCANGESKDEEDEDEYNITFYSQIKKPADKYVFVEEDDPRGYNYRSWVIRAPDNLTVFNWVDRLAVLHHEKSTLGWADGHATMKRWVDKRTMLGARLLDWHSWRHNDPDQGGRIGQDGNQDLMFMKKHFPHLGYWFDDTTH